MSENVILNYILITVLLTFVCSTAFHILKDTTIQFTLEKVPVNQDSLFTYLDLDEPYQSSGLLRVEGKFVNPVQVQPYTCIHTLEKTKEPDVADSSFTEGFSHSTTLYIGVKKLQKYSPTGQKKFIWWLTYPLIILHTKISRQPLV